MGLIDYISNNVQSWFMNVKTSKNENATMIWSEPNRYRPVARFNLMMSRTIAITISTSTGGMINHIGTLTP